MVWLNRFPIGLWSLNWRVVLLIAYIQRRNLASIKQMAMSNNNIITSFRYNRWMLTLAWNFAVLVKMVDNSEV